MREPEGLVVDLRLRRQQLAFDFQLSLGREPVTVIGPNGAGKTTLLQAILGLLPVDEGRVTCGGRVLFDSGQRHLLPTEERDLAYLPQDQGLLPHLTALDNVAFALACRATGGGRRARRELALAALTRVGAGELASRYPAQLSGGERQRIALARVLVSPPAALLCDEPLSALAPDTRQRMRALLLDTALGLEVPTLVVTHLRDDVLAIGGRTLVIENGHVLALAPPEELWARPPSPFVARFFGAGESAAYPRSRPRHSLRYFRSTSARSSGWGSCRS